MSTITTFAPLLLNIAENSPKRTITNLLTILEKYDSLYNDPFSHRLFTWGAKTLSEIANKPMDQLDNAYLSYLKELVDLLVNPITGAFLNEPLLDSSGWVWEKALFEDFTFLSPLSPFDSTPLSADPHLFAEEILIWVKALPLPEGFMESLFKEPLEIPTNPVLKMMFYMKMAQSAVASLKREQEAEFIEKMTEDFKCFAENTRRETEKKVEELKKEATAKSSLLNHHLEQIKKNFEEAEKTRNVQIDDLNADIQKTREAIAKEKELNSENEARLRRLQNNLREQEATIRHLQDQSKRGGCTIL